MAEQGWNAPSPSGGGGGWVIWSRRPHDPSAAPPIIISPAANPPQDIIQLALQIVTPPPSPPPSPPPPASPPPPPSSLPPPSPPPPPTKPLTKSWASLLHQPSTSNTLPTSSVIGFSIPATHAPPAPVSHPSKKELLALLSPPHTHTPAPAPLKIRPRGLINSGNMCFATSVLQMLVYTPPFHRFFLELGRVVKGGEGEAPLVDATIEFLREFAGGSGVPNGNAWGKGKERESEFGEGESFVPVGIYDAMKGKKRFDNMGGGQQEDAEEFLGFYLDSLEEELLSILASLSPPQQPHPQSPPVEEKLEHEHGWLEVGRRNKTVLTRTIKGADSPLSRIFGGKFRSTLRAPHQKDSVIVEDWRVLRLDIQPPHIHTVQDALAHLSHPSAIQLSPPPPPPPSSTHSHSPRTLSPSPSSSHPPNAPTAASQQILIAALPPILILHMKRFCYDLAARGVVKVSKRVRFGPEIVVGGESVVRGAGAGGESVKNAPGGGGTRFKLFGVLYHHGHSAGGGHYTLDVLHPQEVSELKERERWIRIDDEVVHDIRPEDVFADADDDGGEGGGEGRCAYLLFYRRVR